MIFEQITKPALLLDQERCLRNIDRIIQKTRRQGITLRPHFKTHQSLEIGRWFRQRGIDRITVTSVDMANYFLRDQWDDITIAFPVNVRQVEDIKLLCAQCRLSLVVVNPESLDILGHELKSGVHIWIKIDVGTHRTGIGPSHLEEIDRMMDVMDRFPLLHFSGFLGHAGHSYASRTKAEVEASYRQSVDIMAGLKKKYLSRYPLLLTSLGDTPGVSMTDDLRGVDELRPGNFVFYDLQQQEIGSCTYDDIAVALACPVVAIHPERLQWIIHGGGIHFAKDFMILKEGQKCFGRMVHPNDMTWTCDGIEQNPFLISLSQEHGVVQCTEENFNWRKPGDLTLWLPVHSCMTADLMAEYLTLDGQVIDHYRKHTHP